jgi:hypothetical protein
MSSFGDGERLLNFSLRVNDNLGVSVLVVEVVIVASVARESSTELGERDATHQNAAPWAETIDQ